eukprot:COSAG01_NODE_2317_length_7922_cov_18.384763_4_plen_108_part_00
MTGGFKAKFELIAPECDSLSATTMAQKMQRQSSDPTSRRGRRKTFTLWSSDLSRPFLRQHLSPATTDLYSYYYGGQQLLAGGRASHPSYRIQIEDTLMRQRGRMRRS